MDESAGQAQLPEDMVERTLDMMQVGETAFTLPWGMWVDLSQFCWLHPGYPAAAHPFGTCEMRVERRENGYHVWPPASEKYSPSKNPGYASPADTQYIPVVELHH